MPLRGTAVVARPGGLNGYASARSSVLGLAKVLFLCLSSAYAAPLHNALHMTKEEEHEEPDDINLWLYLTVAMVLVLAGGAFAGLTIALMGQDGIYLQVIAQSGDGHEQKHAQRVYRLLKRGKHWVLVTLLLSNVIVNETLPIVLDRSLGGGWPAVLGSTVLIVIFGEVIPQSVCVRYGLQIGAFMSAPVLVLMYLLAPIAWPTAKLLDWLLGEDEGTVYKKSGLKTLVTLHKTLGSSPSDRLNEDEVTIISAVLDLKEKPVGDIMTPMGDVFIMSSDTVLDEKTMDVILSAGYSRIPIHEPGNKFNFIGMLLVKILITYDPEDAKKVSEFALATLPETRPETSCLDIVNFFQEGKSHMVLVSEFPGEDRGAIGVVTLEDVIEELIGEEIIDESDVYIDVHKAIRRIQPAPKARVPKGHIVADVSVPHEDNLIDIEGEGQLDGSGKTRDRGDSVDSTANRPVPGREATFMMRRRSDGSAIAPVAVRGSMDDMREHLKHLGPSNLASRPKTTRYNTVKIKTGGIKTGSDLTRHASVVEEPLLQEALLQETRRPSGPHGGEGEGLLKSAGKDASDGVRAVQQGYGGTDFRSQTPDVKSTGVQVDADASTSSLLDPPVKPTVARSSSEGSDTMRSLPSQNGSPAPRKRNVARSGSITENIIDAGGVRKVVLETHSSSDDRPEPEQEANVRSNGHPEEDSKNGDDANAKAENVKRRRRRKKKAPLRSESSGQQGGSSNGQ